MAIVAQLLCNVSSDGGIGRGVYTDTYDDPNTAGLVPNDPTRGAYFYQDPSITVFNQWTWSVANQVWYQWSSPT